MHEWALADAVITAAARAADEKKLSKVERITVVFGELQNIDPEAFRLGFDSFRKQAGARFKTAKLKIVREKAAFKCRACGNAFSLDDFRKLNHSDSEAIHFVPEMAQVYVHCPKCKSPDFRIEKGRGVYVREIEGRVP